MTALHQSFQQSIPFWTMSCIIAFTFGWTHWKEIKRWKLQNLFDTFWTIYVCTYMVLRGQRAQYFQKWQLWLGQLLRSPQERTLRPTNWLLRLIGSCGIIQILLWDIFTYNFFYVKSLSSALCFFALCDICIFFWVILHHYF